MYTNHVSKGELVICHHGIKGQKWGVRRYQNEDGSLTPEGKEHYRSEMGQRESYFTMAYNAARHVDAIKDAAQRGIKYDYPKPDPKIVNNINKYIKYCHKKVEELNKEYSKPGLSDKEKNEIMEEGHKMFGEVRGQIVEEIKRNSRNINVNTGRSLYLYAYILMGYDLNKLSSYH